jgi:hypothetical protein
MDPQRWRRIEPPYYAALKSTFIRKTLRFSIRVFLHESRLYRYEEKAEGEGTVAWIT